MTVLHCLFAEFLAQAQKVLPVLPDLIFEPCNIYSCGFSASVYVGLWYNILGNPIFVFSCYDYFTSSFWPYLEIFLLSTISNFLFVYVNSICIVQSYLREYMWLLYSSPFVLYDAAYWASRYDFLSLCCQMDCKLKTLLFFFRWYVLLGGMLSPVLQLPLLVRVLFHSNFVFKSDICCFRIHMTLLLPLIAKLSYLLHI